MENIDCHSVLEHKEMTFQQLSDVVKTSRAYVDPIISIDEIVSIYLTDFEANVIRPLQNLSDLLGILFDKTNGRANELQQKYFISCIRVVAHFYCYIKYFIESLVKVNEHQSSIDSPKHIRKLIYQFYYNAAYKLETPYFLLKGFAQSKSLPDPGTGKLREFIEQIYSSPFVENIELVDEISYWTEELYKFIDDLPKLWHEFEDVE